MESVVRAPQSGVVTEVLVEDGDLVESDSILLIVDESQTGARSSGGTAVDEPPWQNKIEEIMRRRRMNQLICLMPC